MTARPLTPGEIGNLSEGLAEALARAGVVPRIVSRPSLFARIARVWRGSIPIMALRQTIWWPRAPDDLSAPGLERQMSLLQHELQHLLEYATGQLTEMGYVLNPANWRYGYPDLDGAVWRDLGAEQRAQIVQDYWLAEHDLLPGGPTLETFRGLIPWARL